MSRPTFPLGPATASAIAAQCRSRWSRSNADLTSAKMTSFGSKTNMDGPESLRARRIDRQADRLVSRTTRAGIARTPCRRFAFGLLLDRRHVHCGGRIDHNPEITGNGFRHGEAIGQCILVPQGQRFNPKLVE